jgi:hypothetical protein
MARLAESITIVHPPFARLVTIVPIDVQVGLEIDRICSERNPDISYFGSFLEGCHACGGAAGELVGPSNLCLLESGRSSPNVSLEIGVAYLFVGCASNCVREDPGERITVALDDLERPI